MVLTLDCTTRLPGTTTAPDSGTSVIQPPATPPTTISARKPVRNSPSKARAARSTMLSPGAPATSADPSRLARNATPAVRPLRTTLVTERSRGTGPAGLGGANWGASMRGGSRGSSIDKTSGLDLGMFMSDGSSGAMIGPRACRSFRQELSERSIVCRSIACRAAHAARRRRGHELRLTRAASAARRRRLGIENRRTGIRRGRANPAPGPSCLSFSTASAGPAADAASPDVVRHSPGGEAAAAGPADCRARKPAAIAAVRGSAPGPAAPRHPHPFRRTGGARLFHRHARDQNPS